MRTLHRSKSQLMQHEQIPFRSLSLEPINLINDVIKLIKTQKHTFYHTAKRCSRWNSKFSQ